LTFPSGRKILVAGFDKALANRVVEEFIQQNVIAEYIPMDAYKNREKFSKASGLVIMGGQGIDQSFLLDALMLAKNLSGDLQDSALEGVLFLPLFHFLMALLVSNRKVFQILIKADWQDW
jgi:hypothetical protein